MIDLKHLPNKARGEETRLFMRRHWTAVIEIFGYLSIFIIIPVVFYFLLGLSEFNLLAHPFWGPAVSIMLSSYAFIVLIILMTQYTDFYLDTWIVTNERIINIEQNGLFSRTISTLHLNQVQDVTAETHGFLPTVLSYGNVFIQTAGTRERFNFKEINDPEDVKHTILKLVEIDKRRHGDGSQTSEIHE